jgi:hypothetical protein
VFPEPTCKFSDHIFSADEIDGVGSVQNLPNTVDVTLDSVPPTLASHQEISVIANPDKSWSVTFFPPSGTQFSGQYEMVAKANGEGSDTIDDTVP